MICHVFYIKILFQTVVMPSSAKTYLETIKLAEIDNGKEIHDQKMKILKIQEEEAAFRRDIASAELNLLRQRSMLYIFLTCIIVYLVHDFFQILNIVLMIPKMRRDLPQL